VLTSTYTLLYWYIIAKDFLKTTQQSVNTLSYTLAFIKILKSWLYSAEKTALQLATVVKFFNLSVDKRVLRTFEINFIFTVILL